MFSCIDGKSVNVNILVSSLFIKYVRELYHALDYRASISRRFFILEFFTLFFILFIR